jgi:tetratricopeptide (TPR) repeat protein
MNKLIILLFAICLLSCKQSHSQRSIDPKEKKILDNAVRIINQNSNQAKQDSIDSLNKVIKLDSNNTESYGRKFMFENDLKRYKDAIVTGTQMMRLIPQSASLKYMIGEVYERMGDTITAVEYYKTSLSMLNNLLDTMSTKDRHYRTGRGDKAIVLILLHQEKQGQQILKDLYESETDKIDKSMIQDYLNWKRHDFIYGP